jgi:hypothetical protein
MSRIEPQPSSPYPIVIMTGLSGLLEVKVTCYEIPEHSCRIQNKLIALMLAIYGM